MTTLSTGTVLVCSCGARRWVPDNVDPPHTYYSSLHPRTIFSALPPVAEFEVLHRRCFEAANTEPPEVWDDTTQR
jgi:hypothetical protein